MLVTLPESRIYDPVSDFSAIFLLIRCQPQGEKPDELYLNLVLEYVPETVYSISRFHQKSKIALPLIYVKLYLYQLSRALAHIHSLGICHRDIKPQNLLVNPANQQLKLCDFGSAKALVKGEPNVSYICSRYYRAPELIFGSTDYTTAIDIWSQGCVGAELLLGQPLFPGDSGVDQLVEIIKVLGTPTREEISSMNSNYIEFKFPQIKGCQWRKVFRNKTPEEAIDFIASTLAYTPENRVKPFDGCGHKFFDELRVETTRLPNQAILPPLFDFTGHELNSSPELLEKVRCCSSCSRIVVKTVAHLVLFPVIARPAICAGVTKSCQRRPR